jgi:hypothetical protein
LHQGCAVTHSALGLESVIANPSPFFTTGDIAVTYPSDLFNAPG